MVTTASFRVTRAPIEGPQTPQSFDQFIAAAGLSAVKDWRFGLVAAGGLSSIKTVTDLAVDFNAYEDNTGLTPINGEVQRYMPFSSSETFVFGSDYLSLKATMGSAPVLGAVCGVVDSTGITPTGNCLLARTNIPDTNGLSVGQICLLQYRNAYFQVTAKDATSFTLAIIPGFGSDVSTFRNNGIMFPAWHIAKLNGAHDNQTTITFTGPVPSGVQVGMLMEHLSTSQNGSQPLAPAVNPPALVASIGTNSITLDRSYAYVIPSDGYALFMPYIKSGQIWSKEGWAAGLYDTDMVAGEIECKIPGNGTGAQGWHDGNVPDANDAIGAWPAFWLYSANLPTAGLLRDSSELDIFEFWNSSTLDTKIFSGFNHGAAKFWTLFRSAADFGGTWTSASDAPDADGNWPYLRTTTQFPLAYHKFQFVWTRDKIFRYIDGKLVAAHKYNWTSLCKAQIGVNLATGSAANYYTSSYFFPFKATHLATMEFRVKSLKVWAI